LSFVILCFLLFIVSSATSTPTTVLGRQRSNTIAGTSAASTTHPVTPQSFEILKRMASKHTAPPQKSSRTKKVSTVATLSRRRIRRRKRSVWRNIAVWKYRKIFNLSLTSVLLFCFSARRALSRRRLAMTKRRCSARKRTSCLPLLSLRRSLFSRTRRFRAPRAVLDSSARYFFF
jgi:hypothetical protein